MTLFEFLSKRFVKESKTHFRRLIAAGEIKVNSNNVNSSCSLNPGDIISIPENLKLGAPPKEVDLGQPIDILFEDIDHLVLNKPAGLKVSPLREDADQPQLHDWLMMRFNRKSPTGGPYLRPHIVHRLDRETSGVLLVAKHKEAARSLSMQFQKRKIRKKYLAVVEGRFPLDKHTAAIPMKKASKSGIEMIPAPDGKEAVTELQVVKRYKNFTLIEMRPLTGRQHQLRVHLKALGYPLAVDFLYGTREKITEKDILATLNNAAPVNPDMENFTLARTPLHALSITYHLPSDGTETSIRAALPGDMVNLIKLLDAYDRFADENVNDLLYNL